MILVEAPNFRLYRHWLQGRDNWREYRHISDPQLLREYHEVVIVLNGGSLDPQIRSLVRRLEVASQVTVSRQEV